MAGDPGETFGGQATSLSGGPVVAGGHIWALVSGDTPGTGPPVELGGRLQG